MFKRLLLIILVFSLLLYARPAPGVRALAASAADYTIEVDINNQITTVYRASDRTIVRQMICSSGRGGATPRGTFYLQKTRESTDRKPWYYISKYRCYVRYATRIKGPYLFHSLPYKAKDLNSIDPVALKELGTKASHGCIRLRWEDAKWIAENCPDGTKVRIFTGAKAKPELRKRLLEEGFSADDGLDYGQFTSGSYVSADPNVLGRGASGEAVRALQNRLGGMGFYAGTVTENYDSATIAAVLRYQSARGFSPTGLCDSALMNAILSDDQSRDRLATFREGMSGAAVAAFQRALNSIGFYEGPMDGIFTSQLSEVVSRFTACVDTEKPATPAVQKAAEEILSDLIARYGAGNFALEIVNQAAITVTTKEKIRLYKTASSSSKYLATIAKGKAVTILEKGDVWSRASYGGKTGYLATSKLKFVTKEKQTALWGRRADALYASDLDSDSLGSAVTQLQDRLRTLGFYDGAVSRMYDAATSGAVMDYQKAAGLEPTGIATVAIQHAIFDSDTITGTFVTLSEGAEGPAVSVLQSALTSLQYGQDLTSGRYDADTADAVRLFARSNGLPEKDSADSLLQEAVLAQYRWCEETYGNGNYRLTLTPVVVQKFTTTTATKLYKSANTSSKALASLKKGNAGILLSKGDHFCKAEYQGQTGYVRTRYCRFYEEEVLIAEFNAPHPEAVESAEPEVVPDEPADDVSEAQTEASEDLEPTLSAIEIETEAPAPEHWEIDCE